MSTRREFQWTQRNEDKPWRCPQCHVLAARYWARGDAGKGMSPRTILTCCGLKWRAGYRDNRFDMRMRQALKALHKRRK